MAIVSLHSIQICVPDLCTVQAAPESMLQHRHCKRASDNKCQKVVLRHVASEPRWVGSQARSVAAVHCHHTAHTQASKQQACITPSTRTSLACRRARHPAPGRPAAAAAAAPQNALAHRSWHMLELHLAQACCGATEALRQGQCSTGALGPAACWSQLETSAQAARLSMLKHIQV